MKEKIENTRGCCDECWNSKFALKGKNKKEFGCGLACECHLKHHNLKKCKECGRVSDIVPLDEKCPFCLHEAKVSSPHQEQGDEITSQSPKKLQDWELMFYTLWKKDMGKIGYGTLKDFIRSAITSSNKALIEKILEKKVNNFMSTATGRTVKGTPFVSVEDIQAIKASLEE